MISDSGWPHTCSGVVWLRSERAIVSLEEHLTALLAQVKPLEPLDITLPESIGCQLVGDVATPRPIPHFARSAAAGYAVRSVDMTGDAVVKVVDDVAPGFAPTQPVYAGVTVRVAAGTPLPSGSDAVVPGPAVPVGQQVTLTDRPAPGSGVVPVGGVAAEGAVVLHDGAVVDSVAVGVLATLGEFRVSVRPRPRVVVVPIGNELLPTGAPATPGLVFDASGPMLGAAAEQHGALSYRLGPVPYESRAIHQAIDDQLIRADLLVVVGDISTPDSLIRTQLASMGDVAFDEGSTNLGVFGHGVIGEDRIPVLALPGDPAAAAVLFGVLAVPMIHAMRGVRAPSPVQVTLAQDVARLPVTQLIPARLDGSHATPVAEGGLSLVALSRADVVLRILPGTDSQGRGANVLALPLRTGPE